MNITQMLKQFHAADKDGWQDPGSPTIPPKDVRDLRAKLILEEFNELMAEFTYACRGHYHSKVPSKIDLAKMAKEAADLVYVVVGTCAAFGIDFDQVFKIVHESNMSKFPTTKRDDGKIMKGPNYKAPDIEKVLKNQDV